VSDDLFPQTLQLEREELLRLAGVREVPEGEADIVAHVLARRFSCRGFLHDQVPEPVINRLLQVSQLSASWCNTQPWHVIITEGAGTERFREAVYAHATANPPRASDYELPRKYEGVLAERRRETAWRLYDSVGVQKGDRRASFKQGQENYRLFGAPHVMIVTCEDDLAVYGAIDCGIYVGSLLMVAESMGIATIPQAAFAFIAPFVREYFGLPDNRKIICGISFGYADHDHPANGFRTARARHDQAVTWTRD